MLLGDRLQRAIWLRRACWKALDEGDDAALVGVVCAAEHACAELTISEQIAYREFLMTNPEAREILERAAMSRMD